MATLIFKTHAQAACLETCKRQCAPHVGLAGCACLGALDRIVEKHAAGAQPLGAGASPQNAGQVPFASPIKL